jgi:DNA-binding MarR family transcriptional regulator
MIDQKNVASVREALRRFNRHAGVLKSDPYGIGLSLSQASALVDMDRFGQLQPNDLVRLLNLEKSSVSRLILVLEDKKLVRITDHPKDGRAKIIEITKAGKKCVDIINRVMDSTVSNAFRYLKPSERAEVVRALMKLADAVDVLENHETTLEGTLL